MSDKTDKQEKPAAPVAEQAPSAPKSGKQPRQRMVLEELERMGLDPAPYGLAPKKVK